MANETFEVVPRPTSGVVTRGALVRAVLATIDAPDTAVRVALNDVSVHKLDCRIRMNVFKHGALLRRRVDRDANCIYFWAVRKSNGQ